MNPILVWYINKMAIYRGGGPVDSRQRQLQARYWSPTEIPTRIQFFLANFHVSSILAISTYIRPNI